MTETLSPNFTIAEAKSVLLNHWNIEGELSPLDSYSDQNFLVKTDTHKFVLKIANQYLPENELDLQNEILFHLKNPAIPELIKTNEGKSILTFQEHHWRLLSFLEGNMFCDLLYRSPKLLENLGSFAGKMTKKLENFNHPSAKRWIQWDIQQAPELIEKWIDFAPNMETKKQMYSILEDWKNQRISNHLPMSVIHADLTRYNILLDDTYENIAGIIDFGDVCYSWTVAELAVLLLETVITDSSSPWEDCIIVLQNYHKFAPLSKDELQILYLMMQLRSANIVCASSKQLSIDPENLYIQKQAIKDLETFQFLSNDLKDAFTTMCLQACGYFDLEQEKKDLENLFGNLFVQNPITNNISIAVDSDIYDQGAWMNPDKVKENISKIVLDKTFKSDFKTAFIPEFIDLENQKPSIALGIYVFSNEFFTIKAPCELSLVNAAPNVVIFKHNQYFFKFYGLKLQNPEQNFFKKDEQLGHFDINHQSAIFTPHLFVQICLSAETPPFVNAEDLVLWQNMVIDPSPFFGNQLPEKNIQNLQNRREKVIQKSQEYYYKKPMMLVRGWKQYLIDNNGKIYLDAINNVAHVGHSHPKIAQVAHQQMSKLNTNARFLYPENIQYAEKLLSHFPEHLKVIFYTCTGSEANDLALRLARAYTGQKDVLVIDGEYHGNTTAVDEISTCALDNPTESKTERPFTHPLIQPNTFRGKYTENTPNVASLYAQDAQTKIDNIHNQGRGVAAFISESLLGSGGGVEMPKGYLQEVYQIVRKAGGVCIADEVQIGFGRMGSHFWGFQKENVLPDIVTLGKPMGNGHPISAVVTTQEIADAYQKKYTYFNTFAGNPVSCQIANTVLDIIEEDNLQQNALETGAYFKNQLIEKTKNLDSVGTIYGHAFYLGVDIIDSKNNPMPDPTKAMQICEILKNKGFIIYPTGDFYNILKIKPPMYFDKKNVDQIVNAIVNTISVIDNS